MVRSDEQRDEADEYCDSQKFKKPLKFDRWDQLKFIHRNDDDEDRVDEQLESVPIGKSDEKSTVVSEYYDIMIKRLIRFLNTSTTINTYRIFI